ncbi:inositol hexakis phosphate and diphosphoinositol-pentakis phosphate kinase PPIP5K1 [Acrasis kona]|uniref:Inositol hexakis phosphate and diphosphoinositol-pentakis phosphate kinase PPIP5K1 n=1 Tax=Acrasis kona TaxID=1008807 RepID=A0AAW2YLZ6_9EUKA
MFIFIFFFQFILLEQVNGTIFTKPFVEKPLNADDHNINIYYHSSQGGGCRKLFRKVDNKSSEFFQEVNEVRKNKSYMYERFMETKDMKDVKVYMVGDRDKIKYKDDDPFFVHAEQRKAPSVDGIVERQENGLEKRELVDLTSQEIEICKKILVGFEQSICGFDFLRVTGSDGFTSLVNDVNGFSNVKNEPKFYDKVSEILSNKLHVK